MPYIPKRAPLDPCPIEAVVAIIGGKWKARLLLELSFAAASFADLRRALPGVTQQVLSTQLRALVADGVVARTNAGTSRYDGSLYALTTEGRSLLPALDAIADWGDRRLRSRGLAWSRPLAPSSRRPPPTRGTKRRQSAPRARGTT